MKALRPFHGLAHTFALILLVGVCSASAQAPSKVRVGYFPALPFISPDIIRGEGWEKSAGLQLELKSFPGPSLLVQAFAAGGLDAMYNNISSALPLVARGFEVRIAAATMADAFQVVSQAPLTDWAKQGGVVEAIKRFKREQGRKFKFGVLPKGAITDMLVRSWLARTFENSSEWVEVVNAASIDQLGQLIVSNALDAACVPEPIFSASQSKNAALAILMEAKELAPFPAAGVLIVSEKFAREHPQEVERLVGLQQRVAGFLNKSPEKAGQHIHRGIGSALSPEIWGTAIRRMQGRFIWDAMPLVAGAQQLADFMHQTGDLGRPVDVRPLFEAVNKTVKK